MTQQMKPSTSAGGGRQLLEQAIECLIALLDLQEVDSWFSVVQSSFYQIAGWRRQH
jgi:hypothetical protein